MRSLASWARWWLTLGVGGRSVRGVAFGFCALGPVVVLHGFAPGADAGGDVVLVAAVLVVAGEVLGGL
jgi:hypothetical protein